MPKDNRYGEIREAYLNWLMTPPKERVPGTKAEFADQYDVNRSSLYDWENKPDFQAALKELKTKWGVRWHGDILNRLMSITMDGQDNHSIQAAKVLLGHLSIEPETSKEGELSSDQQALVGELLEAAGYHVVESKRE